MRRLPPLLVSLLLTSAPASALGSPTPTAAAVSPTVAAAPVDAGALLAAERERIQALAAERNKLAAQLQQLDAAIQQSQGAIRALTAVTGDAD